MFQSLSDKDRELQIQIGLDTLGNGNSFVTRSISSFNPHDQTVQACALQQMLRSSLLPLWVATWLLCIEIS